MKRLILAVLSVGMVLSLCLVERYTFAAVASFATLAVAMCLVPAIERPTR